MRVATLAANGGGSEPSVRFVTSGERRVVEGLREQFSNHQAAMFDPQVGKVVVVTRKEPTRARLRHSLAVVHGVPERQLRGYFASSYSVRFLQRPPPT